MPVDLDPAIFVLHVRPARSKARRAALEEVVAVLHGLGAAAHSGGPFSEVKRVAWVAVPRANVGAAVARIRKLGYSSAIDVLEPADVRHAAAEHTVRWRGSQFTVVRVYDEPDAELRAQSPDRRPFLLSAADGGKHRVVGYRGGTGVDEHRALPVIDARLLVNLVRRDVGGTLIDPFAGAGGVIREANCDGWRTISADSDPRLRFGLQQLSTHHIIADASRLPLVARSVDAIATEPPYSSGSMATVLLAVPEFGRILRPARHMAIFASAASSRMIVEVGQANGFSCDMVESIDRKGTAVALCLFTKLIS